MKNLFMVFISFLLITSCTQSINSTKTIAKPIKKKQNSAAKHSALPVWTTKHYRSAVVSCAEVKRGDALSAKKIAIAKAQAEIAFNRNTQLTAKTIISNSVDREQEKESIKSSVIQNIEQKTSQEISEQRVIKQEIASDNLCVLYGTSNAILEN